MMAIIGVFYRDGLTGSSWGGRGQLHRLVAARLRERALRAAVGFWDPIGYIADGDEAAFKRRRQRS